MDVHYVVIPAIIVLALAMAVCWSLRRIVLLKRSGHSTIRKLIERMLLWALAAAFGAVGLSTAFNAIALYWYRHPPPGNMYQVDGHLMRLACTGQGSPAIVLEAGAGNDGLTARVFNEDRRHQPVGATQAEADDFDLSSQETAKTGPFGHLPILIFTHDTTIDVAH